MVVTRAGETAWIVWVATPYGGGTPSSMRWDFFIIMQGFFVFSRNNDC